MGFFHSKLRSTPETAQSSSAVQSVPTYSKTTGKKSKKAENGLHLLNPPLAASTVKMSENRFPVDIVAVHGFTGDAYTTWENKNGVNWLKDFLPTEFPGARIFSYSYDAKLFSRGTGTFEDFGRALLSDISNVRTSTGEKGRPIIFICHSMGGIIVKKVGILAEISGYSLIFSRALVLAILNDQWNSNTTAKTAAILFLATPHRGSDAAKWAAVLSSVANIPLGGLTKSMRTDIIKSLKREAPELQELARNFRNQTRNLIIKSFIEEQKTPPFDSRIVDTFTGAMEVPNEEIIPMIGSNHQNICQFPSNTHQSYTRVLGVLRRTVNEVTHKATEDLTSEELRKLPKTYPPTPLTAEACLHSLAYPEMDQRRQEADRAHQNTCTWILKHPAYLQWTYQSQGLLWIKGSPGTGKSTLMAFIYRQFFIPGTDLTLSFFFHGRGTILQKSEEGLFRTLLHQLFTQCFEARAPILEAFQAKKGLGEVGKGWELQLREMQDLFSSVVTQVSKRREVNIFVDALDEAGSEVAARLVGYFHRLNDEFVKDDCRARIAISCRNYPVVSLIPGLGIYVGDENSKDILTVVRSQLMNHVLPRNDDLSFADSCFELEKAIVAQAKGLFQWASLVVPMVVEELNDGRSFSDVRKLLTDKSRELFPLYEHILKNVIKGRNQHQTLHLMQWICLAERPLSLAELRFALACDNVSHPDEYLCCEDRDDFVESDERMQLLTNSLSGGLVEVKYHRNQSTVQFVHQTVNDFLLAGGLEFLVSASGAGKSPGLGAIIGQSEDRLSRSCINYLKLGEIQHEVVTLAEESKDKHIFLKYAVKSWFLHAERAEEHGKTQESLVQQFDCPAGLFETWVKLFQHIDKHEKHCPEPDSSLMHVAASSNLISTVQALLKVEISVETEDASKNRALHYAARWGHLEMVKLLLEASANIGAQNDWGSTPLETAAANGHTEIVKTLLYRGADINQNTGWHGNALQAAAEAGKVGLVRILIDCGANVNVTGGVWGSPLQAAALHGHEEVVNILLKHGAEVNAEAGYSGNALQAAGVSNDPSSVRIMKGLLKAGADVNKRGGQYGTALQAEASKTTSWDNDKSKLQLLIDNGADVNAEGGEYGTALFASACACDKDGVTLLLKHGAKFGKDNFDLGIQNAVLESDEKVLKTLLKESTNAQLRNPFYETLLEVAKGLGYKGVADLLRDNGAVNSEAATKEQAFGEPIGNKGR